VDLGITGPEANNLSPGPLKYIFILIGCINGLPFIIITYLGHRWRKREGLGSSPLFFLGCLVTLFIFFGGLVFLLFSGGHFFMGHLGI